MITRLTVPVPPLLEAAIGYTGSARLVASSWEPAGDAAAWDDGQRSVVGGDWWAYLLYVRHPAVAPALVPYHLGSSDEPAHDWLLLECRERTLAAAPVVEARSLLRSQWPPVTGRPSVHDWAAEEVVAVVEGFLAARPEHRGTDEELQARVAASGAARRWSAADLAGWLDGQIGGAC